MKGYLSPISDHKLAGLLDYLAGEDSFAFFETTRVSEDNYLSFLFLEPVKRLVCKVADDPAVFLETAQRYLDQGYYLAGCFSYEFGYLLEEALVDLVNASEQIVAELGVYEKPFIYDHRRADFVDNKPWPQWDGGKDIAVDSYRVSDLTFSQDKQDYLAKIAQIKQYIEAGDTYQVNYTLKLLFDFQGSDMAFYKALRRNQSVSYGAFIKDGERRTLSFSPELFFRKKGNECLVRPMKGTMHRAPGLEEDLLVRSGLADDIKNRSENVMIVDLLRNDLGRLSEMGTVDTVSMFDVETYETLHQMTSSVRGELKSNVGLLELFRAMFPCGSVTGAPKIRTMEIIRELEAEARGVYTGGIGFISPDGEAVFNVPIRTVLLNKGRGEMGIGSGIVYDSDPEKEWDECCLKGRFLQASLPEFKLIETILYHPQHGFWLMGRHLERLRGSAVYWGFSFSEEDLSQALERTAATLASKGWHRVRLLLCKDGGLEIRAVSCSEPPVGLGQENSRLPEVVMSQSHTDSTDPFFHHKTTCRSLYDAEREKAGAAGFFDVLFCNERGEVTEGSITNVFIRKAGKLLTPPLSCGLLGGVLRGALLAGEVMAPDSLPVIEKVLSVKDLREAEAIYTGNSVRGLTRVNLADDELG
ncbi:MAG: aminodeoxychorismate synthase component I [Desulfobulbaceae bacterium]|nr:aminodeoxychorismate synthase component I [Desulfobulbaceae bacterium]